MGQPSDEKRAAFADTMKTILNGQALCTAMCLGYRAGLFEVMDALESPATSADVATAAGLSERYVREWLAVMACGGVVELTASESGEDLFLLPREHADLLTRRAGADNVGVYAQELPLLSQCALDEVQKAMRTGKGVPYQRYPHFQDWMAEVAEAKHRRVLVDSFLPSVADGELVRRLRQGIRVLDVGCSEGVAVLLMAKAFPRSEFVGIDTFRDALQCARDKSGQLGVANARFEEADAARLADAGDWSGSFDYITAFDAIHDLARPLEALRGIRAALKEGGMFSMVDIKAESELSGNLAHPMGPFLYTVSLMHCLPVALMDGGAGLGMMWGRGKAVDMLREAGFGSVEVCAIPEDAFNAHYLCR